MKGLEKIKTAMRLLGRPLSSSLAKHIGLRTELAVIAKMSEIELELRKIADDDFVQKFNSIALNISYASGRENFTVYTDLANRACKLLLSGMEGSDVLDELKKTSFLYMNYPNAKIMEENYDR